MDFFLLVIVAGLAFLFGRSYESVSAVTKAKKEREEQAYRALPDGEKLIAKIEENMDVREIQRLLDSAPLDCARRTDGATAIMATVRYVPGGNYQNTSRRYRILGEIYRRLPKERFVQSLNARDKNGWTALMFAAANSGANDGSLLVHLGADPSIKNDAGETAADISRRWPTDVPVFAGQKVTPAFPKLLVAWDRPQPRKWP